MRFAVLTHILVLIGCANIEQEPNLYEPMRVCLYSAAGRTVSKEFPSKDMCPPTIRYKNSTGFLIN